MYRELVTSLGSLCCWSSTQASTSVLDWWSHIPYPHLGRYHCHFGTFMLYLFHLIGLPLTFWLLLIFRNSISSHFNLPLLLYNRLILIRLMIFTASLHGYCIFLDKVINPFWGLSRFMVAIWIHTNVLKAGGHFATCCIFTLIALLLFVIILTAVTPVFFIWSWFKKVKTMVFIIFN